MYPPVLTPELLSIAKSCETYVFGSPKLFRMHAMIRPNGVFVVDYWYVVAHHYGRTGRKIFWTLNHGMVGQTAAATYDLPADWNGRQ